MTCRLRLVRVLHVRELLCAPEADVHAQPRPVLFA